MRFKTKDLMVSVTPKAELTEADLAKVCALHTYICFSPTYCRFNTLRFCRNPTFFCLPCSGSPSVECPGITAECTAGSRITVFDPTIFIQDRQDIATVRQQLRETLTKLDEIEKGGLAGDIQTRAEAEALEAGLKEALEQVQAAKKNLKK